MKKKTVLSLLSLGVTGAVLTSCSLSATGIEKRSFTSNPRDVFRAEFKSSGESKVYLSENGELIKINDPEDPTVNVVKELKMSEPVASIYYSDAKTNSFQETKQLQATGYPLNATIGRITWTSSDPSIASVDNSGLITALSEGVAIITATSEAGLTAQTKVFVNNTNVLLSQAGKSASNILAKQKSSTFDSPKTVHVNENYIATKYCDGVVVSQTKSKQHFWASKEKAYFRITSSDEEIKTNGGSIVPSFDAYTFYTTDDYLSYLFCDSNGKSNYMKLDQAYLVDEGKSAFDCLGEILQSFFTKGREIMDEQFTGILGQKELGSETGYKGAKYKGSFGDNSGQFAYCKISTDTGRITASQEDDFGIPAGTFITISDDLRYLYNEDLLSAKLIEETLSYTLNGKSYVEKYQISYFYEGRNVELSWPKASSYTSVDSIFDL